MSKSLIGKKVVIISENENYDNYKHQELIITHASRHGSVYDDCVYPDFLCDLKTAEGENVGFSLYEYEFEIV